MPARRLRSQVFEVIGAPYGNRTRVSALRGRSPTPRYLRRRPDPGGQSPGETEKKMRRHGLNSCGALCHEALQPTLIEGQAEHDGVLTTMAVGARFRPPERTSNTLLPFCYPTRQHGLVWIGTGQSV